MKLFLLVCSMAFAAIGSSQKIRIEDNKLSLDNPVLFKTGAAELLPQSEEVLKSVKAFLDEKTYISTLRVEGHVASDGAEQAQSLSERRAQAVVKWLVNAGADCKRLLGVGFGDTKPVVSSSSPDKSANNRIVFAVAALRGHLLGGMPADGGGKAAGDACN